MAEDSVHLEGKPGGQRHRPGQTQAGRWSLAEREAPSKQEKPESQSNLQGTTEQVKEATNSFTQGPECTTGSTDQ